MCAAISTVVTAKALSSASPTLPIDGISRASIGVSVKCIAVYWDPASELSRIRLNTDYAGVCVKPRVCGDGLRSWELLVDFSA
jgi:hypothetical protein